ncbi:HPP family protein [Halomarina ordinaria]|uniref:HPP family protein n=1 Tax=Halomarina ordinaria TaxID=3033939 RepID=A0ABD5U9T3_9EURY|nr:HPP family protein [Halomarina sp. PSRA2]
MRGRLRRLLARLRRVERRELREFRAWLEATHNLVHLSALVLVPLLLALVTKASNTFEGFSFLLFPPLAAGAYTLFANPRGKYSSPVRFVVGLTVGALCGWAAFVVGTYVYVVDPMDVHAGSAALAVFLTGAVTWAFDVEEPAAFSSALLVLVADVSGGSGLAFDGRFLYVASIFASSSLIAVAFVLWRRHLYSARSRYLYLSTRGDDHVLVPMRGDAPDATAVLGARLAAAHDAGKVVLLDLVTDADREAAEADDETRPATDGGRSSADAVDAASERTRRAAAQAATDLEQRAARIRTHVGVPCEVMVAEAGGSPARTVLDAAHEANCDLVATPYETARDGLAPFVRDLFRGDVDVLVHRTCDERTHWKRVLVPVRQTGDVAHEMADFAARLAGPTGRVAVCHCIDDEGDRRAAEGMLADIAETVDVPVETRVARASIEAFLAANAAGYDLVIIGASRDRSAASRFVSRPTFERVPHLDCDVTILDRNHRL